ncbi:MAG TPA: SEC-C metal-binding domain-containing protein [Symbiobacteriaceae bacterium]|jgi:uncharacterized protein|nr:SEC-C metal-binding domain-containing protein [Symbiobacteriaceae bacterium]
MPQPMPGQYAGDRTLEALLTEVRCPMPVNEVRAFVLGCLAATDIPKIATVLSTLWGGESPAFDGMEQMERFTGQFFALWNHLAASADNLGFPLSAAAKIESLSDLQRHAMCRQGEVTAFLRGLDAGHTTTDQLSPAATRALEALGTAHHFWSELERLSREQPTESTKTVRETAANMRQLDQIVGDAIGVIMSEQRRARMQQIRPRGAGPTYVKAATPGRNDPCPCGSGRKYKQCCGKH